MGVPREKGETKHALSACLTIAERVFRGCFWCISVFLLLKSIFAPSF